MESVFGFFFAFLVGLSLGLIGSGGSILTVPILVYIIGLEAITATGYSLFIVGITACVGAIRNYFRQQVDIGAVATFGIPSLIAAYITRAFLLPLVPAVLFETPFFFTKAQALLLLFSFVMLVSAVKMIQKQAIEYKSTETSTAKVFFSGIIIGVLAGAVGAGGGFLIIPALVFLTGLSMNKAVGTSLCIITIQSLAGFVGTISYIENDWPFLLLFSACSVAGIFAGVSLSQRMSQNKLKQVFGYFVLFMALLILGAEISKII